MSLKIIAVPIGIALAGVMLAATPASAVTDPTPCMARVVTAHEGYKAHADGDTIASQKAAFNIGANVGDTDVWMTTDHYMVERHDNDLSTSTNAPAGTLITNLTLAEVRQYTTAQHHEQIPTVAQSLSLTRFSEPYRSLQFETKWSMNGPSALDQLNRAIVAHGMVGHVIIYSAILPQLQYLSSIDPALTLWYKPGTAPPPVTDLAGLDGVMLDPGYLTTSTVTTYHNAGYTVTRSRVAVETATAWSQFVASGADALMTDQPDVVVPECRTLDG